MKCVICGAGQMGLSTIWAMRELGFEISVIDVSSEALNMVKDYFPHNVASSASRDRYAVKTYLGTAGQWNQVIEDANIVISTLPYKANYYLAVVCCNREIPYCDLGGHVGTSKSIHDYALKTNGYVFTDLGLAPGWINIVAEAGYQAVKSHGVVNVEMYVGGLPCNPGVNPMGYVPTWSIDGLLNEYHDGCIILEDGEIQTVQGMSSLHHYEINGFYPIEQMECFYTSGGAAHTIHTMHKRDVERCVYNTIRYKGHRNFYEWLRHILNRKELKSFFSNVQKTQGGCDDIVFMEVCVGCSDETIWHNTYVYDTQREDGKFSAMQVCTTMPLATVASMMARGKLPAKTVLSYEDVPYEEFNEKVHRLIEKQKEWHIGQ